jgi:hypothetical protein
MYVVKAAKRMTENMDVSMTGKMTCQFQSPGEWDFRW